MGKRGNDLELYEVLQRQGGRQKKTPEPITQDFVAKHDATEAQTPPKGDDATTIAPDLAERMAAPETASEVHADLDRAALVVYPEESQEQPADRAADATFDPPVVSWIEGRLILVFKAPLLALVGGGIVVLLAAAFLLGQAGGAHESAVAAPMAGMDPLAEARRDPLRYDEISPVGARESVETSGAADARADRKTAPPRPVTPKGDYFELLIATYPISKRAMAERAVDVFRQNGFEGLHLVRSGRYMGLWGPNFPADRKGEAEKYVARVKAVGPELNKMSNLGQVKGFRDCQLRARKGK